MQLQQAKKKRKRRRRRSSRQLHQRKGRVQPQNRTWGAASNSMFMLFEDVVTQQKFAQVNSH